MAHMGFPAIGKVKWRLKKYLKIALPTTLALTPDYGL